MSTDYSINRPIVSAPHGPFSSLYWSYFRQMCKGKNTFGKFQQQHIQVDQMDLWPCRFLFQQNSTILVKVPGMSAYIMLLVTRAGVEPLTLPVWVPCFNRSASRDISHLIDYSHQPIKALRIELSSIKMLPLTLSPLLTTARSIFVNTNCSLINQGTW